MSALDDIEVDKDGKCCWSDVANVAYEIEERNARLVAALEAATFTREDIEGWLKELEAQCNRAEWQEPFKFGFRNALSNVMIQMDKQRRNKALAK